EGSLRCDANVSIRLRGEEELGTKAEIKKLNSFRNVERALDVEIERQYLLLESGGHVKQETLLYDADTNDVRPMRSKEEANDYRYFPDPDLVPVVIDDAWIERVRAAQPELPMERRNRYMQVFSLPKYDAEILTGEKDVAEYYEQVVSNMKVKSNESYKQASNYVMTDVLRVVNEKSVRIGEFAIRPPRLSRMIDLINEGTISTKIAKEVFEEMLQSGQDPDSIVERKGLRQVSDESAIEKVVEEVLQSNPDEVQKYVGGKEKLFGFFVGEIMKKTRGKANPKILNELLRQKLERLKN
ncbi:MAG: glutaminyl-tRNA synthase (glutamine-hydrolyzing) subunit B, partial [Ignavibacteriae bacterium 37-53-5]